MRGLRPKCLWLYPRRVGQIKETGVVTKRRPAVRRWLFAGLLMIWGMSGQGAPLLGMNPGAGEASYQEPSSQKTEVAQKRSSGRRRRAPVRIARRQRLKAIDRMIIRGTNEYHDGPLR